jgi:hypothetical protein
MSQPRTFRDGLQTGGSLQFLQEINAFIFIVEE